MRVTLGPVLVTVLLASVVGCAPQRFFEIECRGPEGGLPVRECDEVVQLVVGQVGFEDEQGGRLLLVATEIVDCAAAGRQEGIAELARPEFDRCWRVALDYEMGGTTYFAARNAETGSIGLFR